jgi:hypothetical protein
MTDTLAFPDNDGCNIRVSLESRKGIWLDLGRVVGRYEPLVILFALLTYAKSLTTIDIAYPFPSVNFDMTVPSVSKLHA